MSHHDAAPKEELGPSAALAPILAHLTLDPALDRLTVIEFGSVWDGQPDEQMLGLEEEERIIFLLREGEKDGPVIGFMIDGPHGFDPEDLDAGQIWDSPRFTVPRPGAHRRLRRRDRLGGAEPLRRARADHGLVLLLHGCQRGRRGRRSRAGGGLLAHGTRGRRHEGALRPRLHPFPPQALPRGLRPPPHLHRAHPAQRLGMVLARPRLPGAGGDPRGGRRLPAAPSSSSRRAVTRPTPTSG